MTSTTKLLEEDMKSKFLLQAEGESIVCTLHPPLEGTRPECCWHVIKLAPYLQMEIHHNAIVTYNFCREHGLIVVDLNKPRHVKLSAITWEQLLALNKA